MPARSPVVRTRLLATTCLAFFLVGGLGRVTLGDQLTAWDQGVLERIALIREPSVTAWMKFLSWLGGGWRPILIGLLITAALAARRERTAARCYLVTALSGWGLNLLLKLFFQRPRPALDLRLDAAGGYSYPSGHSMLAPIVFGLGAFLLTRYARRPVAWAWLTAGLVLALGIAASRMYLGVHYPSDVVGALLGGVAWSALGLAVYSPLDREPPALPESVPAK